MSRARRERETSDIAAMLRRMIRAYGRRVGDSDYLELAEMLEVRAVLDEALVEAVRAMRDRGVSWSEVAAGLGTTRQGAQQRFGARRAS